MTDADRGAVEKARYAHNAVKAEALILVDEVGAPITVTTMIYAALEIAGENRVCRLCLQKLLIDVLHRLSEAPSHKAPSGDEA